VLEVGGEGLFGFGGTFLQALVQGIFLGSGYCDIATPPKHPVALAAGGDFDANELAGGIEGIAQARHWSLLKQNWTSSGRPAMAVARLETFLARRLWHQSRP
jgi:hypothetical protein